MSPRFGRSLVPDASLVASYTLSSFRLQSSRLPDMAAKDPMLLALGRYLRKVREQRGLSQEQFAFECGVHRTYVGGVERGEYNVTILTLDRFCRALEITLPDAVRGMERELKRRK